LDRIILHVWPESKLTWSFSPTARDRLLAANKAFDAEPRVAELELSLAIELKTDELSVPAKVRRAELAAYARAVDQLAAGRARMHTRTRDALLAALERAGHTGKEPAQIMAHLGALSSAAREARERISGRGGRAPLALREAVIDHTCNWVDRLPPLRGRAITQGALSRTAKHDNLPVPLLDNLERRRLESVKIVLGEVGIPCLSNLRAIIRKVLAKRTGA
jgi:hypothetical protein